MQNILVPDVIQLLREVSGVSQTELAQALGLSAQSQISRIEKGKRKLFADELDLVSRFFDVDPGGILTGYIDYSKVAEKFGRSLPFPQVYQKFPFMRVRSVLPLIQFMENYRGQDYTKTFLRSLGVDRRTLIHQDQPMSVNYYLDFLRHLVAKRILRKSNFSKLSALSLDPIVMGRDFKEVLSQQTTSLSMVRVWLEHQESLDSSFIVDHIEQSKTHLRASFKPRKEMQFVRYSDSLLRDLLCKIRRSHIENLPRVASGMRCDMTIQEEQCHFQGATECKYIISLANQLEPRRSEKSQSGDVRQAVG